MQETFLFHISIVHVSFTRVPPSHMMADRSQQLNSKGGCALCMMRDVHDLRIKGRIMNHQQTWVYTLFAICSFPVNKFSVHFQKSANANFSSNDAQSYRLEERSRASHARIKANKPLYTMHSLLIFDVFTHNSHASRIVYSRLNNTSRILYTFQRRELYILSTCFELIYTNMYHTVSSDGAVSHYFLRLKIYRVTSVY